MQQRQGRLGSGARQRDFAKACQQRLRDSQGFETTTTLKIFAPATTERGAKEAAKELKRSLEEQGFLASEVQVVPVAKGVTPRLSVRASLRWRMTWRMGQVGFKGTAPSAGNPKCLWHSPLVVTPCAKIASALYALLFCFIAASVRFAALSWTGQRPAFSCHDFMNLQSGARSHAHNCWHYGKFGASMCFCLQPSTASQDRPLILR